MNMLFTIPVFFILGMSLAANGYDTTTWQFWVVICGAAALNTLVQIARRA